MYRFLLFFGKKLSKHVISTRFFRKSHHSKFQGCNFLLCAVTKALDSQNFCTNRNSNFTAILFPLSFLNQQTLKQERKRSKPRYALCLQMSWMVNYISQASPGRCQIPLELSSSTGTGWCPALCWEDPCQDCHEQCCDTPELLQRRAEHPLLWLPLVGNRERLAGCGLKAAWHIIPPRGGIYFKPEHVGSSEGMHPQNTGRDEARRKQGSAAVPHIPHTAPLGTVWAPIIMVGGRGMGSRRVFCANLRAGPNPSTWVTCTQGSHCERGEKWQPRSWALKLCIF